MTSQHARGGSVWSGRGPEEDDEEGPWILVLGHARPHAETIPGITSADDFATAASTAQSAGGK